MNLFDIKDQVIVVTGVCGQLGLEYANFLTENNCKMLVGLDLNKSKLLYDSGLLSKKNFLFIQSDITSKESLSSCVSQLIDKHLIPTALINNAAIDSPPNSSSAETGPFEDYPEISWDRVLDVNLKGVFLCCQAFGKIMAEKTFGSIINVSSIYGVVSPDQNLYDYKRAKNEVFYKPVAYAASKSGILNLTRYLAVYWAKKNIRVNSLVIAGVFNSQEDEFLEAYCNRIPIGRMAAPSEYCGAVQFLISKASSYMTGHALTLDGGWTSI
ncbi:SDR family oxidoreductase [Opitutales bacterium]|nr:SDR family oxidoreductase [Opitutales bacterium]